MAEDCPDTTWCLDLDGDRHGDPDSKSSACDVPANGVLVCDDCRDADPTVHPDATERCNGLDDDCDGAIDDPDALDAPTWYPDADGDGYGVSGATARSCSAPTSYADNADDCDDARAAVNPEAAEECNNGLDDNCDGNVTPCGLAGETELSPDTVNPREGGYVSGPTDALEDLGISAYLQDTLADGTADVILTGLGEMYGEREGGSLHLWYSTPLGAETVDFASAHIYCPQTIELAWYPGSVLATDIDADGSPELLIGAWGDGPGFNAAGQILAYAAGITGTIEAAPADVLLAGGSEGEAFGIGLQRADSLAGGRPALLVAGADYSGLVHYGGREYLLSLPDGTVADPLATVRGTQESQHVGDHPAPLEDINGDGVSDLVLPCAPDVTAGSVYLLYGPLAGDSVVDDADATITDAGYADVGRSATTFLDLTGDGRGDIAIETAGAYGDGVLSVMLLDGTMSGAVTMSESATLILEGTREEDGVLFRLGRGDTNADGESDLLVGSPYFNSESWGLEAGALYILKAPLVATGTEALADRADATFLGTAYRGQLGDSISSADANGDGADDLLFYDDSADPGSGGAWFLYGEGP